MTKSRETTGGLSRRRGALDAGGAILMPLPSFVPSFTSSMVVGAQRNSSTKACGTVDHQGNFSGNGANRFLLFRLLRAVVFCPECS